MEIVLIGLGLLIFCSHIFSALFSKTKIPSVLLLMIIGLIIGPVFHLVSPADMGKGGSVFTTITLIAILFQSGTSLDLKTLKSSIGPATLLTILNFVVALGLGIICGKLLLGLAWNESLFLGAAMGGTSSAVVIPMVNQLRPSESAGTILSLESALSDIICLVVAIALLSGFETGDVSMGSIAGSVVTSMLFAILIGVATGFLWIFILKRLLKHLNNSMFTSFALAFILYGFCEKIGINGGMAILAFGLAVANLYRSKFVINDILEGNANDFSLSQNERNFFSEIVFILQTYFFVYIGISISFKSFYAIVIGLVFAALIFITRYPVVSLLDLKGTKFTKRDLNLMRILGPKGLVAAVLSSLPLQRALASGASAETIRHCETIQNTAYAVVFFTIIACSVLVAVSEKKASQSVPEQEPQDSIPEAEAQIPEAEDQIPEVEDQAPLQESADQSQLHEASEHSQLQESEANEPANEPAPEQ